jgi:hypothetical protein
MVDLDYHVIAERPSVVLIGGTARLTTSMQWLGYTIMYSCSDNRLYYMMADSRERPIGALDVHASEPILMSVLPDRVLYACKHRDHRLTQLLSRALVPLEPLVMGLLYAPDGYVKNREELMLKIIRQYAYKPVEEDPNGPRPIGPGYNAGVTGELIREFRKKGYMSVAYAIVRSSGGNKEFPDHPQIAPEVKSDLAMSLHRLDDALQELLSDVPQLMVVLFFLCHCRSTSNRPRRESRSRRNCHTPVPRLRSVYVRWHPSRQSAVTSTRPESVWICAVTTGI